MHAVGVIIENNKGEILVLKRHPKKLEGEKYGLVGGAIEENESKENAIIRETFEETGIKLNSKDIKFLRSFFWEESNITFDLFHTKIKKPNLKIILSKEELTGYLWSTPNDLLKRDDLMKRLYTVLPNL